MHRPLAKTLLAVACLLAAAAHADTLKKIADSNRITVAYRESSVPFSYLAGSPRPVGFAVDLTDAIVTAVKTHLNRPDLQVAGMPVTSQNRIPLLQNGTIDLECGSTTNNSARGRDVAFAVNHFYTGTRLLVKKSAKVQNYADLAGRTVVSTTGTTNAQVIRRHSQDHGLNMNLILGKDHDDALLLVENDRAVAFAMDDILLFGLKANSKAADQLEVVGDALQVEPYACMLRKDDPQFKALVDGVIAGAMRSGEFERLYTKWFLSPIPPRNINLNLPMSPELRGNLVAASDKPAM